MQPPRPLLDHQARLGELQDSLSVFERLHLRSEFLYSLRMLTLCLLQLGDMQRLRELMIEYKFVVSWDEEQAMLKGRGNTLTAESAMANVMSMMNGGASEDIDQEMGDGEVKKGGKSLIERPSQLVCGGMDKKEVF